MKQAPKGVGGGGGDGRDTCFPPGGTPPRWPDPVLHPEKVCGCGAEEEEGEGQVRAVSSWAALQLKPRLKLVNPVCGTCVLWGIGVFVGVVLNSGEAHPLVYHDFQSWKGHEDRYRNDPPSTTTTCPIRTRVACRSHLEQHRFADSWKSWPGKITHVDSSFRTPIQPTF